MRTENDFSTTLTIFVLDFCYAHRKELDDRGGH